MSKSVKQFIDLLASYKSYPGLTSLYHGESKESAVRRENLHTYLQQMQTLSPQILLLGEAPGYKGCRLTGVPFSSERILAENDFFKNKGYKFIDAKARLESEISATIVWRALEQFETKPLIWNIFPFHPYKAGNKHSNRGPHRKELERGKEILAELLELFPVRKIIALGRKAESQIMDMGYDAVYVRHPANGGKAAFLKGLAEELS
jgi:uracil-DNA glycosylase